MLTRLCLLSLGAALLAAPTAAAAPAAPDVRLSAPVAGDIAGDRLATEVPAVSAAIDRAPVAMSWPIDQAADDLQSRPAAHRAESRVWWRRFEVAALAKGVSLPISEPGALLKLSPQDGASIGLDALELVDAQGRVLAGADALKPLVDPSHLRSAGAPFAPGTAMFTLRPDLGVGAFVLRARVRSAVLVHVLERDAGAYLSLEPDADLALVGGRLQVRAHLRDGEAVLKASSIKGELIAPDGEITRFDLARAADGSYRAELAAPRRAAAPGALHTLQVHAEGVTARGVPVRRTVTNAVSIAAPTARYTGGVTVEDSGDGRLRIRLQVEVGAASRFGAAAVLHGTNRGGKLQPLGVGQAADWLEPGPGELVLEFDEATLKAAGLRGPYELRDLRLVDQGRLATVHRQARALALPTARR
ncbi:DUF4785 domain-containing protein [Nannocystis bainbridge]|uniref:DUF4785 family protein n=1 Tax=Nannocystis bainbridge TaxID=2995303 RepID=A0ABT5E8P0_9BACT|nr:DUF4785 domain-containing protein [Nannocystis bainbridge]MDC0722232.1 DUF4785 family protein [Nannocystis bainbridge]